MITRIVKLSFPHENTTEFETIFYSCQPLIEAFDGCKSTTLHCDINNPNQYFTISYWDSEMHLENYRKSELFKTTWGKVKPLFNKRPEAWSLAGHIKLF